MPTYVDDKTHDVPSETELIMIVDDDSAVAATITMILKKAGFATQSFRDGEAFLRAAREITPAAVMLDVYMPGKNGLVILRELSAVAYPAPILMISGRSEISLAVEAIKIGASDFIEKPFRANTLVEKLRSAIDSFVLPASSAMHDVSNVNVPGFDMLTRRELEVLSQISRGETNKEAARSLGLSPRTLEEHRANIMRKLGARNTAELIRAVLSTEKFRQP